jgi:hypothetical protein
MTEAELIERMARAAEPAAHGPAWELAKEAQRRALAAIREALQEPTWEMIDAIRMAWRTTQRPGVSGMTIDAQFAAEHAREYAAYRAMLSASLLKGET